jgi:hypothetical protein
MRSFLTFAAVAAGCLVREGPAQSPLEEGGVFLSRVPAAFVPNLGQWEHPARFVARIGGASVFLEEAGFTLSVPEPAEEPMRGTAVRMRFEGAGAPERVGEGRLAGHHNYFLGSDPSRWRTEVPLYASIRYRDLYPGVALLCYERDGRFEYDLVLAPGADLGRIGVTVEGADELRLGEDGALELETSRGTLRQPRPRTWEVDRVGEHSDLEARYELRGPHRFGFLVSGWSGENELVLDPGLAWSTFVGGADPDEPSELSVDSSGVVTIAGRTESSNFPVTLGAWDPTHNGGSPGFQWDVFVTRLDPSLPAAAQLLYSTFVGGSLNELASGLAVDASGVVTITGLTGSADFPTTAGAWDTTFSGEDAFVTRLDPALPTPAQLVYSTFVGGLSYDYSEALSVDVSGIVTIAGLTYSSDYPTTPGAWDTTFNGGADAFVTRLDPALPSAGQILYSTFVGGSQIDRALALSVDASGVATISGFTASTTLSNNFPTTAGAWDTTFSLGSDAIVARIDPSLPSSQQLLYSTFVGGIGADEARTLSVDASGAVTIAGLTSFSDYPTTPNAWDTTYNGGTDAFVTRLDPSLPSLQQLAYSTFVGGSGLNGDSAAGLVVDASGVVTISGLTSSVDYPTTPGAWDTSYNFFAYFGDAFVTRIQHSLPPAQQLLYSTFVGGGSLDWARALSVDPSGVATIVGHTDSSDYPTTAGAWDPSYNSGRDGFVTRLDMLPTGTSPYGTSTPGCAGPLAIGVTSWPQVGNASFALTCGNAPANGTGLLALSGAGLATPLVLSGASIWIDPISPAFLVLPAQSNAAGAAQVPIPIPNVPGLAGAQAFVQFFWAGPSSPPPCPALGISASGALAIVVQP